MTHWHRLAEENPDWGEDSRGAYEARLRGFGTNRRSIFAKHAAAVILANGGLPFCRITAK